MTTKRAEVLVNSIIDDNTFGRDLDDACVETFATIAECYGPRAPITVTKDFRVLAGGRWLAAVKKLGWSTVEVEIVDETS